jgi:DNA-binding CsgD family transcriptional regulator
MRTHRVIRRTNNVHGGRVAVRWRVDSLRKIASGAPVRGTPADDLSGLVAPRTIPPLSEDLGLVLIDSSLNPISWNDEAIRIISYPEVPQEITYLDAFLTSAIRATLVNGLSFMSPSFLTELTSGKRRYRCWLFHLYRHAKGVSRPALIELVLQRSAPGFLPLSLVAKQFNVSRRERQTVEWLLQGLSSKEIAAKMNISAYTVNSFIRTVMIKMGVTNRAGILGKIITASFDTNSAGRQQSDSEPVD